MSRRIRALAVVVSLCMVGLGACSDEQTTSGGLGPSEQSSTTDAPTESMLPEPTSPPAPDPGGVTVEVPDYASLIAPKGWKLDKFVEGIVSAVDERTASEVGLAVQPDDPTGGQGGLSAWTDYAVRANSGSVENIKVLEPTEIDGVMSYHIVGDLTSVDTLHEYGAVVGGTDIHVRFVFTTLYTKKEAQEIMDSVLPTVDYLVD